MKIKLKKLFSYFLISLLNLIPTPLMKIIGYSLIGSTIATKIRRKESQTHFNIDNGVEIFVDYTNPLTWELILKKDVEKNIKQVFLDNISLGDTVVDVGAHIGEYSIIGSKKIGSEGQMISVEPLPDAIKWLKQNVELNNFSSYEIIEGAIGSKNELKQLYRNSDGGTFGYLEPSIGGISLQKHNLVNVMTIDNLVKLKNLQVIDMLKIDVEGFEYDVLSGCIESFKQNKIKKIICEIHSEFLYKKGFDEKLIYKFLLDNGFTLKIIEKIKSKKTVHILAVLDDTSDR